MTVAPLKEDLLMVRGALFGLVEPRGAQKKPPKNPALPWGSWNGTGVIYHQYTNISLIFLGGGVVLSCHIISRAYPLLVLPTLWSALAPFISTGSVFTSAVSLATPSPHRLLYGLHSIGTWVMMGVFICFCPFSPWQGEIWVCLACRASMPLCVCRLRRETLCWTAILAALPVNQFVWKGRWLYCFSVTPLDLKLEIKVSLHSRSKPGRRWRYTSNGWRTDHCIPPTDSRHCYNIGLICHDT